jgi:hypothetical protein
MPQLKDLPLTDTSRKPLSVDKSIGSIDVSGPRVFPTTDWAREGLRGNPMDRLSCSLPFFDICKNAREAAAPSDDKIKGTWAWAWKCLVEDYSSRCLTHTEDKLPALSGLAYAISKLSGDKYLTGLWQSMLLETLVWHIFVYENSYYNDSAYKAELPPQRKSQVSYSAHYRTPLWSWASVDASV